MLPRLCDSTYSSVSGLLRGEVFNSCAAQYRRRYVAMTIAGLWPFLRQRGFVWSVHGAEARELLQGKRIAIDVAFWAVQGDVAESVTKRCQHFLLTSFWRVCRYLRIGAFPFAVLDAPSGASWKQRRRLPDGQFSHDVRMIKDLFAALGCPTFQASGEAEARCSSMTALGEADAIESGDGDVFAFGASGLLLKSVGGDGTGAWSLEVVDMDKVSAALGVGQQGWIAIAALSGCDFLPCGAGGIGIEKAMQCTRAMLRHCGDEASLSEFMLATLEDGLPDELRAYALLSGCKTSILAWSAGSRCYCSLSMTACACACVMRGRSKWCKRCGHGSVGKLSHGSLGCVQCGTARSLGGPGGCKPRAPGPCPCPFHRNYDTVVLARAFSSPEMLPSASAVRRVWLAYDGGTPGPPVSPAWTRANSELVAKLLSVQCGCPRKDTYRYLLPALLLWDLMHPSSENVEFKAVSVSGECVVGLADGERYEPSKRLAVVEWCAMAEANVSVDLLCALNEMTRAKRSISKRIAVQFCPGLVEAHCASELAKSLRRRSRSSKELGEIAPEEAARILYCDSWGFPHLPVSAMTDLDKMARAASQEPKKKQRNLQSFFKVRRD